MSANTRVVASPPDAVWAVLADPWLYPMWVVGASRARRVEGRWPEVGATLHHSVGGWPLLLDDRTEVLAVEPGRTIRLRARGWPLGEAVVELRLTPTPSGGSTEVTLLEDASAGPGRLVPKPVRTPVLAWRNTETLRRLAYLCERRTD